MTVKSSIERLRENGYDPLGITPAGRGVEADAAGLVRAVIAANDPSDADVLDALELIGTYRRLVERYELDLIDRARELGAGWKYIGAVLGYGDGSETQGAQGRAGRLRSRLNKSPATGEQADHERDVDPVSQQEEEVTTC